MTTLRGSCAVVLAAGMLTACASARAVDCRQLPVGVQVLGSGGPIPDDARASSGYLVWVDGHASVLVDAGGGTFLRLAQSGASLDTLEMIGLSHLHADHAAELPALMKGAYFGSRTLDLPIVGPSAGEHFPGLVEFLDALFGPAGAFRYLSWVITPGEGAFSLIPSEVGETAPTIVHGGRAPFTASLDDGSVQVSAVRVEHGPVPALGFRVDVGPASIAFTGDQNANNPAFERMAADVDVLVVHHAIADADDGVAHRLHRTPSEIRDLVRATRPHTVVLSHHMARSLAHVETSRRQIESAGAAKVVVAKDLDCVPVGPFASREPVSE